MLIDLNWRRLVPLVTLFTVLGSHFVVAQTGTPKGSPSPKQPVSSQNSVSSPTSPEALAALLWQKMTMTCQVDVGGQMKTMTFIYYPGNNPVQVGSRDEVIEFGGAWTIFVPQQLKEVDRLNGIEFRGMAVLGGTARRQRFEDRWGEWVDLSDVRRSLPDWLGGKGGGSHSIMWGHDLEMYEIDKQNGQWVFRVPFRNDSFDPDFFAVRKKSCEVLTSIKPRSK
ncbi:MAG TPA: hypothetical protein VK752_06040 [Bryobacteraceae bacterium]|nr:hypothetical protein [Bryobacteraceae bacterium]